VSLVQKSTRFFHHDEVDKKWYIIDASGKTLGRVSSLVAHILRGKHKPTFTPNIDCGDNVIVVNAEKVKVTGKRKDQKEYFHYTGYPGGATWEKFSELLKTHPERILEHSIKGMIPKNRLGRRVGMNLKVYRGDKHPHSAQKPVPFTLK